MLFYILFGVVPPIGHVRICPQYITNERIQEVDHMVDPSLESGVQNRRPKSLLVAKDVPIASLP